ncbi:unnamed protein product [Urochloa humidicola]
MFTVHNHTPAKPKKTNKTLLSALCQDRGAKFLMRFFKQMEKFAMIVLLVLLLLCYGVGNVHCVHDNSTDLDALLDFKQSVSSDPNGALTSWITSTHYCRWKYSFTCFAKLGLISGHGYSTEISIKFAQLKKAL